MCEGKTDNIYINCAIERLRKKLGFEHKLKFIPHSKILQHLTEYVGGTDKLKTFCTKYKNIMEKFPKEKLLFPIIIIVDNDDAGRKVTAIKNKKNNEDSFTVINNNIDNNNIKFMQPNLYVITIPGLPEANNTVIEDYFDDKIKTFEGKTFNPTNQRCSATEFGKNIFATKVVLPQKNSIDFSKFEPLLREIDTIIKTHNTSEA